MSRVTCSSSVGARRRDHRGRVALGKGQRVVVGAHPLLNPFPSNLGDPMALDLPVIVPEMNLGQLRLILRAKYLVRRRRS